MHIYCNIVPRSWSPLGTTSRAPQVRCGAVALVVLALQRLHPFPALAIIALCRDWEFVSKGTEISLGKFVSEYFTSLTLDSWSGVVSTEDTNEIWKVTKEETMEKVKGSVNRLVGTDSPMVEETEVFLAQEDRRLCDK
jgi:hypothetical protein